VSKQDGGKVHVLGGIELEDKVRKEKEKKSNEEGKNKERTKGRKEGRGGNNPHTAAKTQEEDHSSAVSSSS